MEGGGEVFGESCVGAVQGIVGMGRRYDFRCYVGGIGCGWVGMVDKLTRDVVGKLTRVNELMVGRVDGLMADGVGARRGWQVEGDKVDKLTKDEVDSPVLIVDKGRS